MHDPNMMKGDFENEHVQAKREQLGKFTFDANFNETPFGERTERDQTTLESGAKYQG